MSIRDTFKQGIVTVDIAWLRLITRFMLFCGVLALLFLLVAVV